MRFFLLNLLALVGLASAAQADPVFICSNEARDQCALQDLNINEDCECVPFSIEEPLVIPQVPEIPCVPQLCAGEHYVNPLTCECIFIKEFLPEVAPRWRQRETMGLLDQARVPGTVIPRGEKLLVAFEGGLVQIDVERVGEAVQRALAGEPIDAAEDLGPIVRFDG